MITKLKITLSKENLENGKVHSSFGSLFQGVLMECVSVEYANKMHYQGLKPYSQYLINENGEPYWIINTLNEEAYEEIIKNILKDDFSKIYLKHKKIEIEILAKEVVEQISYEEYVKKYYVDVEPKSFVKINFKTPTAFKSNGEYLIFPVLSNIIYSLINKYDSNATTTSLYDEETINEILKNIKIVDYNLNSTKFYLEKTKIPSYNGMVVIHIKGNDTIKRLINLILHYGNYSGIGIKSSIGMGAVKI